MTVSGVSSTNSIWSELINSFVSFSLVTSIMIFPRMLHNVRQKQSETLPFLWMPQIMQQSIRTYHSGSAQAIASLFRTNDYLLRFTNSSRILSDVEMTLEFA